MWIWDELKYAGLAVGIILLLIGYFIVARWKDRTQKSFADTHLFRELVNNQSFFKYWLKAILMLIALSCLVLAIMGPKQPGALLKAKQKGFDLVIALDVSKSMDAEDVAPSRLIKSKEIIKDLTRKLAGDRIGLVVYAGSAYRMMSLTDDYTSLNILLEGVNTSMMSSQGTSLRNAINLSTELFKEDSSGDRAILILSDGEDHDKDIDQAIANAEKRHVNVVTVGIGTKNGSPVPLKKGSTKMGFKKYKGQTVITKLNEKALKQIAQKAHGTYIHAEVDKKTVQDIQLAFLDYKRTNKGITDYTDYKLYYQYFGWIALALIILDCLIFNSKTSWIQKLIHLK